MTDLQHYIFLPTRTKDFPIASACIEWDNSPIIRATMVTKYRLKICPILTSTH